MAKVVYVCKEEKSNKFWQYEINNLSVDVEWGRVGLEGEKQTKTFSSPSERDRFIESKIREKQKKGYQLTDENRLSVEAEVAREMGTQYKVNRTEYVARKGDTLNLLMNYDPDEYIMVEVLNSWDKSLTYLLLKGSGKTAENFVLDGFSEEKARRVIEAAEIAPVRGEKLMKLAKGVRSYLLRLSEKVNDLVKKVAAGTFGRKLLLNGMDTGGGVAVATGTDDSDFFDAVGDKGASRQVVAKFAALGARKLML